MAHAQEQKTTSAQYLCFRLAGEECAIGILRVREILEYDAVTKVPAMPPWVRGVMNLRGGVVPVIDLTVKFGLPESPVTRRTCIVIVEVALDGEPAVMGVVVDAVSQVLELSPADIEPPPPFGTSVRADYLLGLGTFGDRFVLLLDIDRVLSAAELLKAASLETQDAEPARDGIPAASATKTTTKTRGAADSTTGVIA
ncbi:MAG TPA: chemotaxis protein CheW [Thermoanaerobaculia bacterium]|nr:chemotaxis protein CheW [Thermoanaerobaculia bacterium]